MALTAAEAATTLPGGLMPPVLPGGLTAQQAAQMGLDPSQKIYTTREAAARRKKSAVYAIAFNAGQPFNIPLRHVGYLSQLYLKFTLAVIVTGNGGTVDDSQDAENYLLNMQLQSPSSNSPHVLDLKNLIAQNYRNRFGVNPRTAPGYATWTPGTGATYNVQVRTRWPIALRGRNFATGMIPRNSQQEWMLSGRFCTAADLVGTGTAAVTFGAGTLEVAEEWYDAMTGLNAIPPDFLVGTRLRQITKQGLGIGENQQVYPTPGPTLLDAMLHTYLAKTSDHVDIARIRLEADGEYPFDDRTGTDIRDDNFEELGQQLPTGWFLENMYDDTQVTGESLGRDQVDATLYSQLIFFITVANGATLGASQKTDFVFRELVDLELPAAPGK
jgi:hypothetical protein